MGEVAEIALVGDTVSADPDLSFACHKRHACTGPWALVTVPGHWHAAHLVDAEQEFPGSNHCHPRDPHVVTYRDPTVHAHLVVIVPALSVDDVLVVVRQEGPFRLRVFWLVLADCFDQHAYALEALAEEVRR
jgi:hypothetical protein